MFGALKIDIKHNQPSEHSNIALKSFIGTPLGFMWINPNGVPEHQG
jgi:hypothetical protein